MWLMIAVILAAEAQAPALPAWMAGCWEQRTEDSWTEECWTGPRGGMMMGSSRSGSGDVLRERETMQIEVVETDDPAVPRMAFHGSPRGANRTMFVWVPSSEQGVTFVNHGHDYPQRIRYWREGKDLVAEVALKDGTKAQRWRYSPTSN
jgi:fermentation-respiration switch protein FrsA (DUF1100 family)